MNTIPNEIIIEISVHLDFLSITKFHSVNRQLSSLKSKVEHLIEPWKRVFQSRDWEKGLTKSSYKGDITHVNFFIQRGASDWNNGMASAAEGGHKDLVDFFISKGAEHFNRGMIGASLGGHKDLVDFFIQKGANNWELGMFAATRGGHKDLVEFFIKKGAGYGYVRCNQRRT
jgi:hypothetical protein